MLAVDENRKLQNILNTDLLKMRPLHFPVMVASMMLGTIMTTLWVSVAALQTEKSTAKLTQTKIHIFMQY